MTCDGVPRYELEGELARERGEMRDAIEQLHWELVRRIEDLEAEVRAHRRAHADTSR